MGLKRIATNCYLAWGQALDAWSHLFQQYAGWREVRSRSMGINLMRAMDPGNRPKPHSDDVGAASSKTSQVRSAVVGLFLGLQLADLIVSRSALRRSISRGCGPNPSQERSGVLLSSLGHRIGHSSSPTVYAKFGFCPYKVRGCLQCCLKCASNQKQPSLFLHPSSTNFHSSLLALMRCTSTALALAVI